MTKKENAPFAAGRAVHHNILDSTSYNPVDAVTQFQEAIAAAGSPLPKSIIPDGEIHYFRPITGRAIRSVGTSSMSTVCRRILLVIVRRTFLNTGENNHGEEGATSQHTRSLTLEKGS